MDNNIPKLTLTPDLETNINTDMVLQETAKQQEITAQSEKLTEEEQKAVEEFSKQIDITDTNLVLNYGAGAQKNIADFFNTVFKKAPLLSSLINKLYFTPW